MRRLFLVCAALALVFMALPLIAADSPARAQTQPTATPPPPTTPDQEALRQQLGGFLSGLQDVINTMKANPATAQALVATGSDPSGQLTAAQQQVPQLTSTDLAALQTAVSQNPNWQQIPGELKAAVSVGGHAGALPALGVPGLRTLATRAPAPASGPSVQRSRFLAFVRSYNGAPAPANRGSALDAFNPFHPNAAPTTLDDTQGTFVDSCESSTGGTAPNFKASELFNDAFIANQVQSAIQAIMLATPGVFAAFIGVDVPTGVKIAEAAAWGVANVAFLVLSQLDAIALDCAQNYFQGIQTATFPTDPNNSSSVVAGSSEQSVLDLINKATGTQQQITNVQKTTDTIENCQIQGKTSGAPQAGPNCAPGLLAQADTLNSTLTTDNSQVDEIQDDTQVTQTYVNALDNTENTILTKAKQAITNLNAFQTLQVQMEIEANLSLHGNNPIGLFETPKAQGGYLEIVHDIVKTEIQNEIATGKGVFNAQSYLAQGEAAFAAGQFKTAYSDYAKAYQDATK
ncbi:MAG TPA: hypothetical protein VKV26_11505 [Dehalococcoidia bacterium]|nr:hypothetical protein [Dehalococcoidia bacterium]